MSWTKLKRILEKQTMSVEHAKTLADPNVPLDRLWDEERPYLERLRDKIAAEGIRDPIQIKKRPDGSEVIDDGMHRLAVAIDLGLEQIPYVYVESYRNSVGEAVSIPAGVVAKYEGGWKELLTKNTRPGEGPYRITFIDVDGGLYHDHFPSYEEARKRFDARVSIARAAGDEVHVSVRERLERALSEK